jgi:hypothetical protein
MYNTNDDTTMFPQVTRRRRHVGNGTDLGGYFEIRASRDYKKGDEIHMLYGRENHW